MERYLLFGFDYNYPSGGVNDLIVKFDTIGAARIFLYDCILELEKEYYQILDTHTGEVKNFNLHEKITEYEEIHEYVNYNQEHDIRFRFIMGFIKDTIK